MATIDGARFGHVNLTGVDWRRLAAFYTELFGCAPDPDGNIVELQAWS
jgi:predicted enzyme related to lactoylglutathione lyase